MNSAVCENCLVPVDEPYTTWLVVRTTKPYVLGYSYCETCWPDAPKHPYFSKEAAQAALITHLLTR